MSCYINNTATFFSSCPRSLRRKQKVKHGCQIAIQSFYYDCGCAEEVLISMFHHERPGNGHRVNVSSNSLRRCKLWIVDMLL